MSNAGSEVLGFVLNALALVASLVVLTVVVLGMRRQLPAKLNDSASTDPDARQDPEE